MRRSDSIRNSCSAGPGIPNCGGSNVGIRVQCGPTSRSTEAAGNGIFGCRDEAPKIVIQTRARLQRTKIQELSGRKSPQKRPIWRRIGNVRFAETGWWCAQSYANRSPCYLANIRVIFQKNSEPPALNARTRCGTAAFELFQNLDNRKKQGGRPRLTASGPGSTDSGSRSLDCWGWGPIREAAESEKSCQERQ